MTLLPMDDPQATMFDGPNSQFLRNLPKAPPNRSTNPFAKENRRDTLLAIGAGMMRGGNLGESMANAADAILSRSEEHTSELQSLMRISYAVFCLKKKNQRTNTNSST